MTQNNEDNSDEWGCWRWRLNAGWFNFI